MKRKSQIDWEKVWKSFNQWFDYRAKDYTWETQSKQIEKIVERSLKFSKTTKIKKRSIYAGLSIECPVNSIAKNPFVCRRK